MSSSKEPVKYRHGIKVWHSPASPTLDICFIHGLNGDRDKTWTPANGNSPWPAMFLAPKYANSRLLTYGYDANVVPAGTASTGTTLRVIADDLNRSLKDNRARANYEYLPIIFVAHSLGGLVCKRAVYRSFHSDEPRIKAISSSLLGIIFMGTPHTGSLFANMFSPLVSGISIFKSTGKKLLQSLKKDGETATDLNEDFVGVVKKVDERTGVFCFFESRPMRGVKHLIVNRASGTYPQWPSQMIDSDHSNMVKFQSDEDPNFSLLCGVIDDYLRSERAKGFPSLHPPAAAGSDAPIQASAHTAELEALPGGDGHGPSSQFDDVARRGILPIRSASKATDKSPQRISHLYFDRNPHFVGREDVIDRLKELFFDDGLRTVALSGLGGVGKTQVANALAYWVKDHKPEYSVAWLPTISRAGFGEACTAIAKKLPTEAPDKSDIPSHIRDYISNDTTTPWFIIIDNADDPTLICDKDASRTLNRYFPKGDHVRTLVTTRTVTVAESLADETLQLEAFGPAQAMKLTQRLLGSKWSTLAGDESSTNELLEELEFLPLAISQAMAYMKHAERPAETYLRLLRATDTDRVDLLGTERPDKNRYKESAHAVATTWLVTFDHLRETDPDAVKLLEFLSQILPKAVPLSMLPVLGSETKQTTAVMGLQTYSFVSLQGDFLDMHRLVHVAASSWFDKNGQSEQVSRSAFAHMSGIYPEPDYDNQSTWSQYQPHALHMLDSKESASSTDESLLCRKVSESRYIDGHTREAVRYGEMAVDYARLHLHEEDPDRLVSQHALAMAYEANGQIQKAVHLFERFVHIYEKTLAENHPDRLVSQALLAVYLPEIGQVERAKTIMRHVVSVSRVSMPHHPDCKEYEDTLADIERFYPDS